MIAPMQTASSPPLDTALLWERLRALFARVIAAVGAPAIIAALTLTPRMGAEIVRELALVEILARKLLLADAVAFLPPPQRGPRLLVAPLRASGVYTLPQPRRRRCAPAPARPRALDLANPDTWSARFALALPRDPRAVQERRAPRIRALWCETGALPLAAPERAPPQRQSEAFRIARRAEALRRMLNDPSPYARRLARARGVGVTRSREIITRYALRAPRRFTGDRHDPRLTIEIFSAAIGAQAALADTS